MGGRGSTSTGGAATTGSSNELSYASEQASSASDVDWREIYALENLQNETEYPSGKQQKAFRTYAYQGDQDINNYLRHGAEPTRKFASSEKVREAVDIMDDLISRSSTPQGYHAWRVVNNSQLANAIRDGTARGMVLEDKGFTSTSLLRHVPHSLATRMPENPDRLYLRVTVPKGSKAVLLGEKLSRYSGEAELLIHRGARFVVSGTHHQGNTTYVDVTLLP